MSETFFEILGVERKFHLEAADLERRFHEKSRLHHPDRHARSDAESRVKNALFASQLNQAYRTLREPIPRAEYLLKVEGIAISDERSGHEVSPAFLLEIMELREELADARIAGDRDRVASLAKAVKARSAEVERDLDGAFSKYERGDRSGLAQAADALVAERYFRRYLEEADAFLDPVEGAKP